MDNRPSPTGRYVISLSDWGPRMSHTILVPTLIDQETSEVLLKFEDSNWSLDASHWITDNAVRLVLRKYPGNHVPGDVTATVHCGARTAEVNGMVVSLDELEALLDRSITWRT